MSGPRVDAGLRAVARVRAVRERDSLLGLQQAQRELRGCEAAVAGLEETVRDHGAPAPGDLATFLVQRHALAATCQALTQARTAESTARTVTLDAGTHWRGDHTRVEAVEGLLARRSERRRAESARHEAAELDEVATRLWLHRREEDA